MKIFILGAGTMGSGIAQIFAQSGYDVILRDIKDTFVQNGIDSIKFNLQKSVNKGKLNEHAKKEILEKITPTTDINLAKNADLIVEAAVENVKIKKDIFSELDRICKEECVLATNTSSLSITEIASATNRPDRVIGMHFFNPVPVMKLIEVIKGICTSNDTTNFVLEISKNLGKNPIKVEEAPGFVVNRILIPMINESIGVLADKVASKEDIDLAMKLGANHPIGPLSLADLIGNDVCLSIMETLYLEFGDPKYRPHPLLRKMVKANLLGRKTKQGFFDYSK